jgi:adenylate cyclase
MSLIAELKRRKLVQWALAYAAGAWALLQALSLLIGAYHWPDAVLRIAIVVVAIGFLITLVLAWYHGERGAQRLSRNEMLLLTVLLALGGGLAWRTAHAPELVSLTVVSAKPVKAVVAVNPKSIAVLPFVNMSGEAENEFFSDGLSEEILNSLARIDGMQVVGRTSSFQFKGKNEDLRVIGEKLGVATVLEGSVRREGERARITAQLIRASDGIHLWSQTYDRTLKDTLAVQLDIAEQVAGALNVVLDDKQRVHMREAGVKNVDAFIAYQKGWKLYIDAHRKPDVNLIDGLRLANVEFDKAIVLEPDFSFAYFAETDLYEHILIADDRSPAERLDAQRSALRSLQLAADNSPDGQQRELALSERQSLSDDWHGLSARIETALKQPGCSAPNWMPVFASAFGYGDLLENLGARASACDPLNSINFNTRSWAARATGHPERALAVEAAAVQARGGGAVATANQAIALAMLGRIEEARKLLASMEASGESYYMAQVIVSSAAGEDAASIHARLQNVYRKNAKLKIWAIADAVEAALSGNRAEADRQAAALDARPAGGLLLAVLVSECQCGAPFDLEATPNFKARLAESGLHWPPPQTIKYPRRAQESKP